LVATPSSITCWRVRYRHSPVRQPAASPCLKSLRRLARSTCSGDHVPLLLTPFSLPSLPHSLHLQTFPHQDSTYEGPFAFAHPVRIQGYPEFRAHALSFMVVRA